MSFLNPEAMALFGLSQGLLAAGAPTRTPTSLGGALAQGMQGALQNAMLASQYQRQEAATKLAEQKLARDMAAQDAFSRLYGPQVPSAASGGSVVATGEGMPAWAQPPVQRQGGPTLEQIAQLGGMDPARGKFALEIWQAQNPDLSFDGGIVRNRKTGLPVAGVPNTPNTNQQGFSTTPVLNQATGQFEVQITPGGPQAFAAQQDIQHRSSARYEPYTGESDAAGRPIPQTREQFADRMRQRGSSPVGMGPTPAQKETAVTLARGDSEQIQKFEQNIPKLVGIQRRLGRLADLTTDEQTYAAAGAEFKKGLGSIVQAFGLDVNKVKTANTEEYIASVAELLKDRLSSKDYGSGSGVSNLDLISASQPLPQLAKTAQGRQQIIAAIKADTDRSLRDSLGAREYFEDKGSLRGFRYPSESERPPIPKEAAPKNFPTPPAEAIRRLKMKPDEKAQFDAIFGPGAAARALGK